MPAVIRYMMLAVLLSGAVHGAEVFQRACTGTMGVVMLPVYVQGKSIFQCVTPEGWRADVRTPDGAAVRFTALSNRAASISVVITPVSLAEHELQAWRIPILRRALTQQRDFNLQSDALATIDETPAWQAFGTRRAASDQRAEAHSFHIRHGYLFTISALAPERDDFLPALRTITMTFRSFDALPDGVQPSSVGTTR